MEVDVGVRDADEDGDEEQSDEKEAIDLTTYRHHHLLQLAASPHLTPLLKDGTLHSPLVRLYIL